MKRNPKVLSVDIGGTGVKILATGQTERRRFASGRKMTPESMVAQVKELAADWKYDVVAIGYPGRIVDQHIISEPRNLGPGWVGFDFAAAFGCPVKLINDAAMQALGGYRGGRMLYLGFGTGLGSALIIDGVLEPMELGHLPYKRATYEDYVGAHALKENGKKKWRKYVNDIIENFRAALEPDDILLGGGNAKHIATLPAGCRLGGNTDAFAGGFRLWRDDAIRE